MHMSRNTQTRWGVCDCGKWGEAPSNFRETIHFLKCSCGRPMYLDPHNPKLSGYRDSDKIDNVGVMKHNQKI